MPKIKTKIQSYKIFDPRTMKLVKITIETKICP